MAAQVPLEAEGRTREAIAHWPTSLRLFPDRAGASEVLQMEGTNTLAAVTAASTTRDINQSSGNF